MEKLVILGMYEFIGSKNDLRYEKILKYNFIFRTIANCSVAVA